MSKVIHDLTLQENQSLSKDYRLLVFRSPANLPPCSPGQFAELAVFPPGQVFLRRPFSIHHIDYQKNTISFLIKMVGSGTRSLGGIPVGTVVSTLYPLGKGFSMPEKGPVLLTGGGCGIAPLLFLVRSLHEKGIDAVCLFGGGFGTGPGGDWTIQSVRPIGNTTEDGSAGTRGLITEHSIFHNLTKFTRIYSCGPEAMLRAVALHAFRSGVSCEVSLENTMACGIGACLCCVVKTRQGNQCVCTEGPVFNIEELTGWDAPGTVAETCPV